MIAGIPAKVFQATTVGFSGSTVRPVCLKSFDYCICAIS